MESLLRNAYIYHKNTSDYNNNFDYNIMKLNINEQNITTKIKVNYIRKNSNYSKDIYILMISKMKDNIILKENTQYFFDITYYVVPPAKSNLKIFV